VYPDARHLQRCDPFERMDRVSSQHAIEKSQNVTAANHLTELESHKARLTHLQWLVADLKFARVLRRTFCTHKAGFNPNQPRVPAGNPDGGQWTRDPRPHNPTADSSGRTAANRRSPRGSRGATVHPTGAACRRQGCGAVACPMGRPPW
jgi:hypothetical protein